MQVPVGLEGVLKIDPEIMHGALCFSGTRVPLVIWLDCVKEGLGTDEFLENYPTVNKEQVEAVLAWERSLVFQATGMKQAS